jgi:hypothetical protein
VINVGEWKDNSVMKSKEGDFKLGPQRTSPLPYLREFSEGKP